MRNPSGRSEWDSLPSGLSVLYGQAATVVPFLWSFNLRGGPETLGVSPPGGPTESKGSQSKLAMSSEDQSKIDPAEPDVSQSSEGERASLLASVARHHAERTEAQARVRAQGPKPLGRQLVLLALATGVAVYAWFGSPGWLNRPPPPPPTLAEEASAVRAAMWITMQQVEAFRRSSNRTPGGQELGPLPPGVDYRRLDARGYLLVGRGGRIRISYSSREPQDEFIEAIRHLFTAPEAR